MFSVAFTYFDLAHVHPTRDERTIFNKLNAEVQREHRMEENRQTVKDPLKPATDHGNKPSRGAMVDAQLQNEDQEILRQKAKSD